jgi:hypothetical protein
VLDTLLPSGAHSVLPDGIFDARFQDFYRDFTDTANRQLRYAFALAVVCATWIAPLLIGRPPPLGLHPRATRERALAAMETSRFYLVRQMMVALKAVASLCYGASPDVRDAIGYPLQHDDPRVRRDPERVP